MNLTRRAQAFAAIAAVCCSFSVSAQFSNISSEEMNAIPFERMTLVAMSTGSSHLDSILYTMLQDEWKLTPRIRLLDTAAVQRLEGDSSVLFLDLFRFRRTTTMASSLSQPYGGINSYSSTSVHRGALTPPEPTRSNGSASPGKSGPRSTFFTGIHDPNMGFNEGIVGVFRGGGTGKLNKFIPAPGSSILAESVNGTGPAYWHKIPFVAFSPIDLFVRESDRVQDPYRLRMVIRGLMDGVALMRSNRLTGSSKKLVADAEQLYSKRSARALGKKIMIPRYWLAKEEEAWFTQHIDREVVFVESRLIEDRITAHDSGWVLLLPLGHRLMVYDIASLDVLYCYNMQRALHENAVMEFGRRWRLGLQKR
jgi:hypothetical protein